MKFSKVLIIMGICCFVGLLLVFGMRLQAQGTSKDLNIALNTNEQQPVQRMEQFRNRQQSTNWNTQERTERGANRGTQERSENTPSNDDADYYSVIVDNNIFRPLGWRPPNKQPEYTFIGTSTSSDGTILEGYVLERRSNRFYTAGIGDKIGDAVVTDIKEKEILLDKDGEQITLKPGNMQFLQGSGSSRENNNRNEENADRNASSQRDKDAEAKEREAAAQRARAGQRGGEDMRSRFRNASPEERERMIREFRERGGSFRGRRR